MLRELRWDGEKKCLLKLSWSKCPLDDPLLRPSSLPTAEGGEVTAVSSRTMSKDRPTPAPGLDDPARNGAIAALATQIMEANGASLRSLTGHHGPDWWKSFRTATLQAERMLQEIESRGDELIHAYRLFPRDPYKGSEPQSLPDIASRFTEVKWGRGMGESTLRTTVVKILEEIEMESARRREGFYDYLERHNFKPPEDTQIDSFVKVMLEDFAVPEVLGDVTELQGEMAGVIRRLLDRKIAPVLAESGTSESPSDPVTIDHFMEFVCGYRTVDEAKKAKRNSPLVIRPYELFLYAHEKKIGPSSLTRRRGKLDPLFVPQPEYLSPLSIMVAYGGSEEMLSKWAKEEEDRLLRLRKREEQAEHESFGKRLRGVEDTLAAERHTKGKKRAAGKKKSASEKKKPAKKKTAKKGARKASKSKTGNRKKAK
jgi:hypothetical protein